jgi:phosphoenolpyruvate synthase/pyruvate phosphate dikinase
LPASNRLASLDAVGAGDIGRVGGKASGLGELLRAGLEVPPGFVITFDAFRLHLRESGVEGLLNREAQPADIRARILSGAIDASLSAEVTAALDGLGRGPTAVRSSALAEDLPGMSFAGQHETFLNLSGAEAVLDAARRCWASLFSDHAVSYRRLHHLDLAGAAMACVVQRMVPAEAAGVAFTADPRTGERDRVVINVVRGLGESLVSGRATADEYVVAKSDGAVLHRRTSGILGGNEAPVLAALGRAALRAESHFKIPLDVEWAWAGGRLFVLQSRPITNLREEPVPMTEAVRPLSVYIDRVREMFPSAGTPLLNDLVLGPLGTKIVQNAAHHGLLPASARSAELSGRIVRGRFYIHLDVFEEVVPGMSPLALLELLESGRMPPLRALSARLLLVALPLLPRAAPNLIRALLRLDTLERESLAAIDSLVRPYEVADWVTLPFPELLGVLRLEPTPEFARAVLEAPPANVLARGLVPPFYSLLGWMCARWAEESAESASSLVSGLSGLVEVECAMALWDLAESARANQNVVAALQTPATAMTRLKESPAAAEWMASFRAFLAAFGHRAIEEVELGRPRWREQPAYPLSIIASYLRCGPEASPRVVEQRRAKEREIVEARILARLRFRPLRRFLFRHVLDISRKASLAGENTKSAIMRIFWIMRCAALEIGRRFVGAGRLTKADDIFFLTLAEIATEGVDFRPLVVERRALYDEWQKDDAPRIIDGRGRAVKEGLRPVRHAHEHPEVLTGIPSSAGIARGAARIVRDPAAGVTLHDSEILVAPYTDPAWTPLFIPAAAVVVEIGSLLSHASIVAREMGIPSVVAVAGATTELVDGDLIEVDGTRGTVRRLRGL